MSTHNIGFYEDLTEIIFELSSNMHLIFSAVYVPANHKGKRSACTSRLSYQSSFSLPRTNMISPALYMKFYDSN